MAVAVPLVLMAASAAAAAKANSDQKKAIGKGTQLAREGRDEYNRRAMANVDSVQKFAQDRFGATNQTNAWDKAATDFEGARMGEIAAAGPQQMVSGDASNPDALAFAGSVAAKEGERTSKLVRLLSKVQAPQAASFDDGLASARFGSEFASRGRNNQHFADANGVDVADRFNKAQSAGGGWRTISSLFGAGASMYGGANPSGAMNTGAQHSNAYYGGGGQM